MIIVHHRIFKVLIFWHRMCVCYVFNFSDQKVWNFKLWAEPELNLLESSSSPNKRRRRRWRTGKKGATQSLQALYYIFLQEE